MSWQSFAETSRALVNAQIFQIGKTPVTIGSIAAALSVVAATFFLSRVLRRWLARSLRKRGRNCEGTISAISTLVHYGVIVVGLSVALQTIGLDLGAVFAAGAVFAVGIGLALQSVVKNFVSGVILIVERSIQIGHVLEVDGKIVRVEQMRVRTTIVVTHDGDRVVIPNSRLVQNSVRNLSLENSQERIRVTVGVSYHSDMDQVVKTLRGVGQNYSRRLSDHDAIVRLVSFDTSSVAFELAVWIDEPWDQPLIVSELNIAVWRALRDDGIVIAFPQMDVHVDTHVVEALAARAA